MTDTQQSTMARYGVLSPVQPRAEAYPEPRTLYRDDGVDVVAEHGEWCADRCWYPENKAHILRLLAA